MKFKLTLLLTLVFPLVFMSPLTYATGRCQGHFVNPITDICWRCLFPLSIGSLKVAAGDLPDTDNPKSPIGICPAPIGFRIGLNIGYWEPIALTDVVDKPYCFSNLGGLQLNIGKHRGRGGRQMQGHGQGGAFFHVHWYKYPLMAWLNLITSMGCLQGGDFDVAYISELDPTWNDSEMAFVLNPESVLFANATAQVACAADSLKTASNHLPLDALFWCAGSQGSLYPLTGHVGENASDVGSGVLLTERMAFKLHRQFLLSDSSGKDSEVCEEHHRPFLPKSRYRYEMVNQVPEGQHCHPFGHTTLDWEAGHIKPNQALQFGFLVWRKRNCTFL